MKWYNGNQTGGVPGNLPDPYYWVRISQLPQGSTSISDSNVIVGSRRNDDVLDIVLGLHRRLHL